MRFFAFLTMMPDVWSLGQCDANGVCTVKVTGNKTKTTKIRARPTCSCFCAPACTPFQSPHVCSLQGGIKNGDWWRKELNKAQEECVSVDPEVNCRLSHLREDSPWLFASHGTPRLFRPFLLRSFVLVLSRPVYGWLLRLPAPIILVVSSGGLPFCDQFARGTCRAPRRATSGR